MGNEQTPSAGVEDGTVLVTTTHDGEQVEEKVIYNEDGTWQKEVVS